MKARNKKRKFSIFSKIMLSLFLVVLLILIFGIFRSDFFVIKVIDILAEKTNCVDVNKLKEESNLIGQNFFLVDEKKIKEFLKGNFICIKNINFSKNLPDKIKLTIIGRSPVANLYSIKNWDASASSLIENTATPTAQQKGDAYLIDDEGVVFSKVNNLNKLPQINIIGTDLTIGINFTDNYLNKTLKIQGELKHLNIDSSQTFIFNNFFINAGSPKVVFDLNKDIDIQIASLQLIVQKAKIDESRLEFIDLRFDKPIVKFAPKKK